jgi:hypothetical protein
MGRGKLSKKSERIVLEFLNFMIFCLQHFLRKYEEEKKIKERVREIRVFFLQKSQYFLCFLFLF